jgi:ectoine hydroxylase
MLSLAIEHYPSRTIEEPLLSRRREPVLWGQAPARPRWLLEDMELKYRRDGFLVLPELLPAAKVQKLTEEMQELRRRFQHGSDEFVVREPDSSAVRSIFDLPSVSRVFAQLTRHPLLLEFARYILGSDVYLHQTRLNYKPGFEGREFYWHSDFETWHVEDGMPGMRALSCLVLLSENNAFNAPLLVIPGSHTTYVGCVGPTPEENYRQSLLSQTTGTPAQEALPLLVAEAGGIQSITGPAGTVAFFDSNLLHASFGNITPYPRANAFLVYNSVLNRLEAPLDGLQPRPEYIAHRQRTLALNPLS